MEASDKYHDVRSDPDHYRAIAPVVSTSIPQIRRDFTSRFVNGQRYLDAAGRKYDQPTHYARKIMLLSDIYEDTMLDRFIGYCVDLDKLDFSSFKELLRQYNAGKLVLPESSAATTDEKTKPAYSDDDSGLIRDCSYYEQNAMKEA